MMINISNVTQGWGQTDYVIEESVRLGFEFGLRYWLADVYMILISAVVYTTFMVLFVKYPSRWFQKFKDVSFIILMILIIRLFVQMLWLG